MSLDPESKQWLKRILGENVIFDEPMARHTSFRVGGPAEAYIAPVNTKCLAEIIHWSVEKGIPYMVIGDGTNLLVKDSGIQGLAIVLKKCLEKISKTGADQHGSMVTAMAGAKMQALCWFAINSGLEGMNFALGIPGTVGGGIMMNAGTAPGSVEEVIDSVKILLPTGQIQEIGRNHLRFGYRGLKWEDENGRMPQGQRIILEGCFSLGFSDPLTLKKEAGAILKRRREWQPARYPSAGCFFKNPPSGKTAGELIDQAGLKKKKVGDAAVSEKHANFIVNAGNATAADILSLMEHIQETVFKLFNVKLEPEVKIVGT